MFEIWNWLQGFNKDVQFEIMFSQIKAAYQNSRYVKKYSKFSSYRKILYQITRLPYSIYHSAEGYVNKGKKFCFLHQSIDTVS